MLADLPHQLCYPYDGYARQHTPQRSAPLNRMAYIFEKVVRRSDLFYIRKFADLIIIDQGTVTPAEKFGGLRCC